MWYGYGNDVRPEVDFDFFAIIKIDVDQNVLSHSGACVPKRTAPCTICVPTYVRRVIIIYKSCQNHFNYLPRLEWGVLKFVRDIPYPNQHDAIRCKMRESFVEFVYNILYILNQP